MLNNPAASTASASAKADSDIGDVRAAIVAALQRPPKAIDATVRTFTFAWLRKALSDYEGIKVLCTIVTTLSVIVAGALTFAQAKHWAVSNEIDQYNKLSEKWLEIDKYFIQHPDLRVYFYAPRGGKPAALPREGAEGKPDRQAVISTAYYAIDFMDYVLTSLQLGMETKSSDLAQKTQEAWIAYFQKTFLISPAICEVFWRSPDGYGDATKREAPKTCPKPR